MHPLLVRLMTAILTLTPATLSQNLIGNFDEEECIKEDETIQYTCTVLDEHGGGGTVWDGSIFDCPSMNDVSNNKLYLSHSRYEDTNVLEYCNGGAIQAQSNKRNGSHYVSTLTVITTREMNNGTVKCSNLGVYLMGIKRMKIGVVPAQPHSLTVQFSMLESTQVFTINWNKPSQVVGGVGGFVTRIVGDYGVCSNVGNVSASTTDVSCEGWAPEGQSCNFTVGTVTADCAFESIGAFMQVHLRYPKAPVFIRVLPTYSMKNVLTAVEMILSLPEGQFDENGLPVTYGVRLQHNSGSHCFKMFDSEGCTFNCKMMVRFPEECAILDDGFYSVVAYSQTTIGKTNSLHIDVVDAVNKFVELTIDVQQSFTTVYARFDNIYERVSSDVGYDDGDCHHLSKTKMVGINTSVVSTLLFDVVPSARYCFIATIDNGSYILNMQGDFIGVNPIDGILLVLVITTITLFFSLNLLLITGILYMRKRKQLLNNDDIEIKSISVQDSPHIADSEQPTVDLTYEEITSPIRENIEVKSIVPSDAADSDQPSVDPTYDTVTISSPKRESMNMEANVAYHHPVRRR